MPQPYNMTNYKHNQLLKFWPFLTKICIIAIATLLICLLQLLQERLEKNDDIETHPFNF
jgi:hypothetical protein